LLKKLKTQVFKYLFLQPSCGDENIGHSLAPRIDLRYVGGCGVKSTFVLVIGIFFFFLVFHCLFLHMCLFFIVMCALDMLLIKAIYLLTFTRLAKLGKG